MRFIIQDNVFERLPSDWTDIVDKAKTYVESKVEKVRLKAIEEGKQANEVDALCLKERHKAINEKSDVWRKASDALKHASNGKCWYCEIIQERSDKPVDHFRPKNSVIEAPNHPGYHWLAFDWTNFRYSCTFCNSFRRDIDGGTEGGKKDHFPIIAPPPYAYCETDLLESPKLLDPVNNQDPKLLTFLTNGEPKHSNEEPETVERVKVSIELYHLNHITLVRKRKMLFLEIDQLVLSANEARNIGNRQIFKDFKTKIIKLVQANAELSSAARIHLRLHRSNDWVQEILERDL